MKGEISFINKAKNGNKNEKVNHVQEMENDNAVENGTRLQHSVESVGT